LAWYVQSGRQIPAILSGVALATSLLVSYTRARAEGIGAQCKQGLFTRLERLLVIIIGLVVNQMEIALWVIAILSVLTALQRIYVTAKYVQAHFDQEDHS
jgi:CDP-diacylglycerol--glycerol-3-phosphate 3-phosphatidyltransferase